MGLDGQPALLSSPNDLAALYQRDPTGFYLLARGLVALQSTATVALIYLLGRSLSGRLVGLISAGLLAVTFSHAREAHYAVTDTLVAALVVASLLGAVLYDREPRKRYLALAGMAGGAAIGLKYLPAPILIPPLFALLRHGKSHEVGEPSHSKKAVEGILILGSGSLAGFLLTFPAPFFSLDLFGVQWRQVWAQASGPLGGIRVDLAPTPLYYLKTLVWGLGIPFLIASILGLVIWLRKRQPAGYVYVLVFIISYFAVICLVETAFARYALPLVPLLALFAAQTNDRDLYPG